MKTLILTASLWAIICMPILHGQARYSDTLKIFDQERLMIKVITPKIQYYKDDPKITRILESFRKNLESVRSQIPDYVIYKITYEKDVSLQVEEIEGLVKYQVNNGETSLEFNQSVAHLRQDDLVVSLYFNQLDELNDRKYEAMITNAFEKMGKPPGKLKEIYFPINVYNFSYSQGKMIKLRNHNIPKNRLNILGTLNAGVYKNALLYEWGLGVGWSFGVKRWNLVYLFYTDTYTYSKEADKGLTQALIGVGYASKAGSVSIAFPISDDLIYEDIDYRIGLTSRAIRNVAINFYLYSSVDNKAAHPGVSIGFAF